MTFRLLEDGTFRLLEDGGRRLLDVVAAVEPGRRQNFLLSDWYFNQQEDFQDVVDFAEGRTGDPFYV